MAKIKFGMMMTDARGKLGGQVFSKNRSGAYVRTKVTPSNPQTAFQTSVRQAFGGFSQAWSGLTDGVRAGWNNAVSSWGRTDVFGDLVNPTGKNLFLRLNQQATQAGYPSFTTVPAKLEMVEGIATSVTVDTTLLTLEPIGIYAGVDAKVVISGTPQLSQGTSFVKNKLRDIYSVTANTFDINAAYSNYVSRFGAPGVGTNIYFGIKYVLPNGQASPVQTIKASVVA